MKTNRSNTWQHWLSSLYAHNRGQATLVPRRYHAVIVTELNTVIPARQLGLCRTNWSFNCWSLFLSVCASGLGFIFQILMFNCMSASFWVCMRVWSVYVFCLLSSAEQSSAKCKGRKKLWEFIFWHPTTGRRAVLYKVSQCAWIIHKKSVFLS